MVKFIVKDGAATKSKWWKKQNPNQWESRNHPDFLFISVYGSRVVRRVGNYHFNLIGTKPVEIYNGKDENDARAFARKWVKTHSDKLGY